MTDVSEGQMRVVQINMQSHFGGGEVYTAALCRALSLLGVPTRLICHRDAHFWRDLQLPADTEIHPVAAWEKLGAALPAGRHWIITHGAAPRSVKLNEQHLLTGIAHMPLYGRDPTQFLGYHKVFAVSRYVLDGLNDCGIDTWPEPLYGVADLAGRDGQSPAGAETTCELQQRSCYEWDRRKVRDRLLGWLEPWFEPLRLRPAYSRRPGLTLAIVSRLTPIKQFPLLLSKLAPVLARHPQVNLEIFGAGGYASVRDLRRALAPIRDQVRFWGYQQNVAAVYRQIDYLMTGLPEKEALGLNIIEAEACGTPVLAVAAAPFSETVIEGETGFFYRDPRQDDGADFAALLERLLAMTAPLRPQAATAHLERFSYTAFVERLKPVVSWAKSQLPASG